MSITLHELADRMRDQFPCAGDSLEIRFSMAGLIESATLVHSVRHLTEHGASGTCYCAPGARTKIV